jgi:hypothetical protein
MLLLEIVFSLTSKVDRTITVMLSLMSKNRETVRTKENLNRQRKCPHHKLNQTEEEEIVFCVDKIV